MKGRAPLPGSGMPPPGLLAGKGPAKAALAGTAALAALLARAQPLPDDDHPTCSADVDLIDMPNARMAPDGELSVGAEFSQQQPALRSELSGFCPGSQLRLSIQACNISIRLFRFIGTAAFGLRSACAMKPIIMPAVAVGVDDLIGTGVYGGEYLSHSKRFGSIDTSLGIGLGPLC